ncbi:MAG: hypothetical protein HY835_08665 [Anaerolineae bacterium]|nr:hypothetical protein [Anaerolineae bacterium]
MSHVPLVRLIGVVQARDRAPGHHASDRIADCLSVGIDHSGPNGLEIRGIQLAIPRSAHDDALGATAAHPEYEDAVGIARKQFLVVAHVTHGRFQVGNTPGCATAVDQFTAGIVAILLAAHSRINVDKTGFDVAINIVVTVGSRGLVSRITARFNPDDHRGGLRSEAVMLPASLIVAVYVPSPLSLAVI